MEEEETSNSGLFCWITEPGDIHHCLKALSSLTEYGVHVIELDIKRDAKHNLLDTELQIEVEKQIRNREFAVVIVSPPCTTWSRARHREPGPRPLRDITRPYGLPNLLPFELLQLEEGNALAKWSLKSASCRPELMGYTCWSTQSG